MKHPCSPADFPLKSFFLAPHSENKDVVKELIGDSLDTLFQWRETSFERDDTVVPSAEKNHPRYEKNILLIKSELDKIQKLFAAEIPRHSPRYLAHMFSEYSIPALLGHFIGLLYNPNNISTESSQVGIEIERAAIGEISKMIGYPSSHAGHFTSGGTVANLEMLYRFKKMLDPRQKYRILIPKTAHYSWKKGIDLLGLKPESIVMIETDLQGAVETDDLEKKLKKMAAQKIRQLAVISIVGTTEFGSVDPLYEITKLLRAYRNKKTFIWHHIDAAYGGFYATLKKSEHVSRDFKKNLGAIKQSDSITIDPHKLGYVPYASGCFVCRNKNLYRSVNNSAPYVDFTSLNQPGPYTIEGSRSAAGAIATLLSAKTIGFTEKGLGRIIEKSIDAAKLLASKLRDNGNIRVLNIPDSNILCFYIVQDAGHLSDINKNTKRVFDRISKDCKKNETTRFYVSKTILGEGYHKMTTSICKNENLIHDCDELFLIRCTIMNPFIESKHYTKSIVDEFRDYINICIRS